MKIKPSTQLEVKLKQSLKQATFRDTEKSLWLGITVSYDYSTLLGCYGCNKG